MGVLVWDNVGDRKFESGVDRGVLYLSDGTAVPWNGLTAVVEKFDRKSNPVYFDGMKISDQVVLGDFAGVMKAITFPDEFLEFEGYGVMAQGAYLGDQKPKTFGLCYRTRQGDDVGGDEVGYKIHVLYNVTAIAKDRTYETVSDTPNLTEFEWDITAVPEEIPNSGFRPTAHFILDTVEMAPELLEQIEAMLYGTSEADAALISMTALFGMINGWISIDIVDNGDGTWSAISDIPGAIVDLGGGVFQINDVEAELVAPNTYEISDTYAPPDE